MLTATAMQDFEGELEKAVVLTLFIPLIMSSGGNSGSQATSLIIRALALRRSAQRLVAGRAARAAGRPDARRHPRRHRHRPHRALAELGFYDYGPHWLLVALTVGARWSAS